MLYVILDIGRVSGNDTPTVVYLLMMLDSGMWLETPTGSSIPLTQTLCFILSVGY